MVISERGQLSKLSQAFVDSRESEEMTIIFQRYEPAVLDLKKLKKNSSIVHFCSDNECFKCYIKLHTGVISHHSLNDFLPAEIQEKLEPYSNYRYPYLNDITDNTIRDAIRTHILERAALLEKHSEIRIIDAMYTTYKIDEWLLVWKLPGLVEGIRKLEEEYLRNQKVTKQSIASVAVAITERIFHRELRDLLEPECFAYLETLKKRIRFLLGNPNRIKAYEIVMDFPRVPVYANPEEVKKVQNPPNF